MRRLAVICALLAVAWALPNGLVQDEAATGDAAIAGVLDEGVANVQADGHYRRRHHSSEEHHSGSRYGHHSDSDSHHSGYRGHHSDSDSHHSDSDSHHSYEHHSPEHHSDSHHSDSHHSYEHHSPEHHSSSRSKHGLYAKVRHVNDKIDHLSRIVERRGTYLKEAEKHGLEILNRIMLIEGDGCEEGSFQCLRPLDGEEHQCVSDILVCDHHTDCRSHWDEDHLVCKIRSPRGSVWVGSPVSDHCTTRQPGRIEMVVTDVHVDDHYPSFPHLDFSVLLEYEDDEGRHKKDIIRGEGYYDYANFRMVMAPPEDDRLGLTCTFDGVRDYICFGAVVHEATLDKCAEFVLHRIDDHHHSDSHHSDSDSHQSDHHSDSHHSDHHSESRHYDDSHHSRDDSREPWEFDSSEERHRFFHLSDEEFWH